MRPEITLRRNNVAAFLRQVEKRGDDSMKEAVRAAAIELANRTRANFLSGQEVNVRTGLLRQETVAFPPKVTGKDIRAGVGVLRKAFYARFLYKGVPHPWEITPHKWSAKALARGRMAHHALYTPFGPRARVFHRSLERRPFLIDALKAFRPEFRARLVDAAKKAVNP